MNIFANGRNYRISKKDMNFLLTLPSRHPGDHPSVNSLYKRGLVCVLGGRHFFKKSAIHLTTEGEGLVKQYDEMNAASGQLERNDL